LPPLIPVVSAPHVGIISVISDHIGNIDMGHKYWYHAIFQSLFFFLVKCGCGWTCSWFSGWS